MKKILIIGLFSLCLNLAFAGTGAHALERASKTFLLIVEKITGIDFQATSYISGLPVSGVNTKSN